MTIEKETKKNLSIWNKFKKHRVALALFFLSIVIAPVVATILQPYVIEGLYRTEIILDPEISNGYISDDSVNFRIEENTFEGKMIRGFQMDLFNPGLKDIHSICIEIIKYPENSNWLETTPVRFLGNGKLLESEDGNLSCMPFLFSKQSDSIAFSLVIDMAEYTSIIRSDIEPKFGLKIFHDDLIESYERDFKIKFYQKIVDENLSSSNKGMIPVLVTEMGPERVETFPGGSSISMSIGSTRIMYLETEDGKTPIIPDHLAHTKIEVIKKPIVELDQKVYTWTDKISVTIIDPARNFDKLEIERIGEPYNNEIIVMTKSGSEMKLVLEETGFDTGFFTGEITLTGFQPLDANNDGVPYDASGKYSQYGLFSGFLPSAQEDEVSVLYRYDNGKYSSDSAEVRLNIGELQFFKSAYKIDESAILRLIDPDVNLNPDRKDFVYVKVYSDSDPEGIELVLFENNETTGIFEGEIKFTVNDGDNEDLIMVSQGDQILAEYVDRTLPKPYEIGQFLKIHASSQIE